MSFKDKLLQCATYLGLVEHFSDSHNNDPNDADSVVLVEEYVGCDDEAEWFTLDSITPNTVNDEKLYCITVDSPGHQFLIGEGFEVPTHNSDEAKMEQEMRDECRQLIGSILRLGRAAGVHFVGATQRPDAKMLPGEMKANMPTRVCAGSVDGTASSMILDDSEGTRVKSAPRGRTYVKNHQTGFHAQGFFVDPSWIDNYRASIGLNPDGTPLANFVPPTDTDNSPLEEDELLSESASSESIVGSGVPDGVELAGSSHGFVDYDEDEDDDDDDDDGGFEFVSVDIESLEKAAESTSTTSSGGSVVPQQTEGERLGLVLGGGSSVSDKYHHPEDDWDDELDAIVSENKQFLRGN